MRCLDGTTNSMDMNLSKLWEIVKDREGVLQSTGWQRVRLDLATEHHSTESDEHWSMTHTVLCVQ